MELPHRRLSDEVVATKLNVCASTWSVLSLIAWPCDVKNVWSALPLTGTCGERSAACDGAGTSAMATTAVVTAAHTSRHRHQRAGSRLWESPWLFALVVAMPSAEWTWRRRRGL